MGTAYTPGLTVSPSITIQRTRRLPIKGETLVALGEHVAPQTVVARAYLPGLMQSVKVANILGIDPGDVESALKVKIGDTLIVGQVIAETKALFGWLKTEVKTPVYGDVETISNVSGNVGVRQPPIPIEITGYISGDVVKILSGEGVVVETTGALVQGIFGVGGERTGVVQMLSPTVDGVLTANMITPDMAGKIIVGGANLTGEALRKADALGVSGIIAGGIVDKELIEFLGYDIGVAITGHEKINTTVVVTEGFGSIPMAQRTFNLLKTLEGRMGSINGATQIRAGVIRPELIVPSAESVQVDTSPIDFSLDIGVPIRVIREPYFGELATVSGLPPQLVTVESGAEVRVLEATLRDGRTVTVPRANVEIVAG